MKSIQELEQEASRRRARLAQLQREFRSATDAAMSSPSMNGENLVAIAGSLRAAELSVEGIERDLAEARRPKRVAVTSSRKQLELEREQCQHRLEYQRAGRAQAEERILSQYDRREVLRWRRVLLDNNGLTEANAKKQDAQLVERLAHIEAQLAELDRRESAGPEAA